jgi:cell division protein FtsB
MTYFPCAEEVILLARDKEERVKQLESLHAKLREAEENVAKLKEAMFSKDAAFSEMKEHLEIPLRKVAESLSGKLAHSSSPLKYFEFPCVVL